MTRDKRQQHNNNNQHPVLDYCPSFNTATGYIPKPVLPNSYPYNLHVHFTYTSRLFPATSVIWRHISNSSLGLGQVSNKSNSVTQNNYTCKQIHHTRQASKHNCSSDSVDVNVVHHTRWRRQVLLEHDLIRSYAGTSSIQSNNGRGTSAKHNTKFKTTAGSTFQGQT